jgi:aconitate hydratase
VTSPELATAFAFSGSLSFNPLKDSIVHENGDSFKFQPPNGDELPNAFSSGENLYQAPLPPNEAKQVDVKINPSSDRLQKLEPFEAWKDGNVNDLVILMKVKGKCTTDHISPAGPWYDYRGHLDNISHNMLTGAENAFLPDKDRGMAKHALTGEIDAVPVIARSYKGSKTRYCIIGQNNY